MKDLINKLEKLENNESNNIKLRNIYKWLFPYAIIPRKSVKVKEEIINSINMRLDHMDSVFIQKHKNFIVLLKEIVND